MKKVFVLLMLSFSIGFVQAQTTSKPAKFNDKSIVVDESGNIYPYSVVKKLLETEEYAIRRVSNNEGPAEFQIYRIATEQLEARKKRRLELATTLPKPRSSEAFKDGEKFRFDRMKDLTGKKIDFKADTGKVVVLNFWFINCPPCKKEIPELNELVERYKDEKQVQFIAIALDDAYSLKEFLKVTPFNYNIIPDGRYYAQKYGVKSFPTHVIVGKDGKVKFSTVGLALNTIHWVDKTIKEQL